MRRSEKEITGWKIEPGSLDSPLIIAHRGHSAAAPENTMDSFRRAVESGADGVELDVRLTKDGEVAVIHDRRVDRTTTGNGPIGTSTLAEARRLDAGSWFSPLFKSARVPSLNEVFDELPPTFLVNVELKVMGHGLMALVSKVVESIRHYGRWDSTLVASSNPLALGLLRLLEPRVFRGYIWSDRLPRPIGTRWLSPAVHPHWMDPGRDTFTPSLLERLHRLGKPVLARDLDVGSDLERLAAMRLDAVATDCPEVLVRQR